MKFKIIIIFFAFLLGFWIILKIPVGKSISFLSPDHKYGVYGKPYLYTYLFSMAPGDGNSKHGKVYLFDTNTDEIIEEGEIDFISDIKDIQWEENKAYFIQDKKPNISEPWILPAKIKLPSNKVEKKENSQTVYEYDSFDKLISIRKDTIVYGKRISMEYKTFDDKGNVRFEWKVYKLDDNFSYVNVFNYKDGKLESSKKSSWNN